MQWADCEFEDRAQDVHQMVGRQLVRFANRVKTTEVIPYSEIYGVHPRLVVFAKDGSQIPSGYFLADPYEVIPSTRRTGAEGEREGTGIASSH